MSPLSSTTTARPALLWVIGGVIALSSFLAITSESLPSGLLPEMSAGLASTESQTGFLVGVFAITVAVTSPPLTILLRRVPRHTLIVVVVVLIGVGAILTGFAATYGQAIGARILGGVGHGLFWATVNAYQARLVPREQLPRLLAISQTGGTMAFILGVPLGTLVGHLLDWRASFVLLGLLTIGGSALLWWLLPRVADEPPTTTASMVLGPDGKHRDRSVLPVTMLCIATATLMIGYFSFSTFVVPYFTDVVGLDPDVVPGVLLAGGVAGGLALIAVALWFGRNPLRSVLICAALLIVALVALALTAPFGWVALVPFVITGFAFGAIPPLLITVLLSTASSRIRDIANAYYTTAFNVGIGAGSLLGGATLDLVGAEALPWVEIAFVLAGAMVLLLGFSGARRRQLA